jgi:hypothetical protein
MKTFLVTCMFSLLCAATVLAQSEPRTFSFTYTHSQDEHSKDSNSQLETYSLMGNVLKLHTKSTGAHASPETNTERTLTPDQVGQLDYVLQQNELFRDYEKTYPNTSFVNVTEKLRVQSQSNVTNIVIQGPPTSVSQDPVEIKLINLHASLLTILKP